MDLTLSIYDTPTEAKERANNKKRALELKKELLNPKTNGNNKKPACKDQKFEIVAVGHRIKTKKGIKRLVIWKDFDEKTYVFEKILIEDIGKEGYDNLVLAHENSV